MVIPVCFWISHIYIKYIYKISQITSLYDYLMKDERQDQETQTDFEQEEVLKLKRS